ncbi:amidoligase family protein [Algiphilus sp.]|uniref:amidoligase family protein n=1 Tax=Algiphilus sp. TaxID=1872431 RepID=UPI0025B88E03|nr:amidoligase family protein [Algiphilus sp.]MCK5769872.1 amidoligase family protein [Algiphilus sp.]
MIPSQFRKWWRRRERPSTGPMPPRGVTASGDVRRLGLEFEFSGLSLARLCELVPQRTGGQAHIISDYEAEVRDTRWGTFGIELDFAFLKAMGREQNDHSADWRNSLEELSESLLAALARQVVPFEIVTPPVPMDELDVIDGLVGDLRRAGARGTRHSPLYAFGLHLNVELPAIDAATLLGYMQAYALLYPWLRERCHPDISRRLSPYIEPYPLAYARHILQPGYAPDQDQLIDDYLTHNPTRNRSLDMLPVFALLDEARVQAVADDDRIKSRPALHYRLPNCQIDEPDWRWREIWRDWLQVEHLAGDDARRQEMAAAFLACHESLVDRLAGDWERQARAWLLDDASLAGGR